MEMVQARIVVPAHVDHLFYLANHMAEDDRRECEALGFGPLRALRRSLELSVFSWTGMLTPGMKPVCMWGLIPFGGLLSGQAAPWFSSTDELGRHRVFFVKRNRKFLRRMLDLYPHLTDYVDVRHKRAIRWLKWLGFTVGPEIKTFGPNSMPFYKFEMKGDKCLH